MDTKALNTLKYLIKKYEGLKLKAYKCPAGIWTCGYGSTGKDINQNTIWTPQQAEQRMEQDAITFIIGTKTLCPNLTNNKLAAIADFAYNLGLTRLKSSTLRKKLLINDYQNAASELLKWIRASGKILPGLIKRRQEEASLLLD